MTLSTSSSTSAVQVFTQSEGIPGRWNHRKGEKDVETNLERAMTKQPRRPRLKSHESVSQETGKTALATTTYTFLATRFMQ